jgi:DNA modification methylase
LFEFKKDGKTLHRLLCGDSTDTDQVAKLMNNEKADMVFTDPPYDFKNLDSIIKNIDLFVQDAHIFIMNSDKHIVKYLRQSNCEFVDFFIARFDYHLPGYGNAPYQKHNLIAHEKKGKAIKFKNLYDGISSVIKLENRHRMKDELRIHKHQKPIKFVALFVEHYSNENMLVLDFFLGAGTTMLASHQLNRRCYGVEIEPKWCQVIIDRMLKLDNELKILKNGKPYEIR